MSFQVVAVEAEDVLSVLGTPPPLTVVVDARPGYPCRNTLADAEVGKSVLLVHYQHQPQGSHAASGPIYLAPGSPSARFRPGEVPVMLRTRMLSLRGYDPEATLIACELVDGREFELGIERMFSRADVDQVHVHFAAPGCYACRVERLLV